MYAFSEDERELMLITFLSVSVRLTAKRSQTLRFTWASTSRGRRISSVAD
jgi:hypothetical protein